MIKMIAGVYGMPIKREDGSFTIKAMSPESGSFSLSPEDEKMLVEKGVAKYVESVADMKPFGEMTAKELRELGKKYGITFKVGVTKAEMADAIAAKLENSDDESDESESSFDDSAIENETDTEPDAEETDSEEDEATDEDAPTFDAADAVK